MPEMNRLELSYEDAVDLSDTLEKSNERLIKDEKLKDNQKFRNDIKEYIEQYLFFMRYTQKITEGYLYRVRIVEKDENRFEKLSDLLIPPKDKSRIGRMNNENLRVLYATFDQNTAEFECAINKLDVGDKFQVTKFKINEPINYFHLGMLSEIIFNLPFKSEAQLSAMEKLGLKNFDLDYRYLKRIALAEGYLADTLYAKEDKDNNDNNDNDKNYYILTSLISEIIFDYFKDEIDAIVYPTQRKNYGLNIAIKETKLKKITPDITFENEVKVNHSKKYVEYKTLSSGYLNWSTEKIEFEETPNSCHW